MKSGTKDAFFKIYYLFLVIVTLIYDVFLSAVKVSRLAFSVKPSLSPRIDKVRTSLKNSSSTAISANFITLPQGTLAMDFDISTNNYTIHWIDVNTDVKAEAKKARIRKHENLIAKIVD